MSHPNGEAPVVGPGQTGLLYASNADYTEPLNGFVAFCLVASSIALILRCTARWMGRVPIGVDDVLIVIGHLSLVAEIVACFIMASSNGMAPVPPTPAQQTTIVSCLFGIGFTYPFAVIFSRLSLLFMYRRIFGMRERWFRISWWAVFLSLFPGWTTAMMVLTGMQLAKGGLDPAHAFGDISVPIMSSLNAAIDLAVLILPIGRAVRLQLSPRKKAGLVAVFALGSLGSLVSIFRAGRSIQALFQMWDPRYKLFHDAMLGTAEATTIVICACLPVLRPLVRRVREKTVGSFRDITTRSKTQPAADDSVALATWKTGDSTPAPLSPSVSQKKADSTLDFASMRTELQSIPSSRR